MKADRKAIAALLALSIACGESYAAESDDLTLNLIDLLVQQGVIDRKKADQLVAQAKAKAAACQTAAAPKAAQPAAPAAPTAPAPEPGDVRVTYVPEFVKDEIRQEVRKELRDEVVKEVKVQAKEEKWGIPAALPEWVTRFKLSGDMRLRFESDMFGSDNQPNSYFDWPLINKKGGITHVDDPFLNTTVDRQRYRMRWRLALDTQITDGLTAGVRLATSNDRNPISNNQTLGQYGEQYEVAIDRAFMRYDLLDEQGRERLNLWGGRFANPWLSSDNLFDQDLSFEGAAAALHLPMGPAPAHYHVPNPFGRQTLNMGVSKPNQVFLTLGAFPLQEIQMESTDKWMWAAQAGVDWVFSGTTRVRGAIGYFDYNNIVARRDPLGSRINDWSAPQFFTKGNSVARISNDVDTSTEPRLVGLASDFNIIDAIITVDWSGWGANHVMFTANYSDNLGFDQSEILSRTGLDIEPRTQAYQVRVDVGRPEINRFGDWNVWMAYKYLQRDSVLDAFTDSNFHLAGTDAQGWSLGVNYGLARNTWANLRWMSTAAIDGPPFDVDVLLADLNARF